MRVFITGDKHGNFDFLEDFCSAYKTTLEDVLIILGDAGILYYGRNSFREKYLKDFISRYPITLFCVRGNHEDRATDSVGQGSMIKDKAYGGTICYEMVYPNILYAIDGEEYTFNKEKCLVIGGAYSVDKEYRKLMGYKWNPSEQLNDQEREDILRAITGKKYDHIFTHTCPLSWEPSHLFMRGIDQSKVDTTMEEWLENVIKNCSWNNYWFGHFHGDESFYTDEHRHVMMMYNDIYRLN